MSFDPTYALRFDLPKGSILSSTGNRFLMFPVSAFEAFAKSLEPEAQANFGAELGAIAGNNIQTRIGGISEVKKLSLAALVHELAGETALFGLGKLSVERWGKLLVVHIEEAPALPSLLYSSFVETVLKTATGSSPKAQVISFQKASLRVLLASPEAISSVQEKLSRGRSILEALSEVQES